LTVRIGKRDGRFLAGSKKNLMEIERHCAEVEGQKLHYLKSGSGPPLLLIHGLLGSSFCWRCNMALFSERYTALAVDLPGFGESDAPSGLDCGMQAQARRLLRWLDDLQHGSVDVVASSWGGGVALFLAAMSGRVRSLVLAAPVNPWSQAGLERVRFLSGRLGGALLRLGMPVSRPLHPFALRPMYGDPGRIPPGTLEGYSEMMLRKGRARSLLSVLRCWENDLRGLRGAIEQVRTPALLVWGTRDGAVDIRSSDILMQKIPGCERAMIEGAGHLPFEETPEEFNRVVLGFLGRDWGDRTIGRSGDREIGKANFTNG
jgi:pimeloyl-ACP methyl ester carboxylesterase